MRRIVLHPTSIFLFLCLGVYLATLTYRAFAVTTVSATIEARPLTQPAVIRQPQTSQTVRASRITVSGSCPNQSYTTISNNDTPAAMAWCDASQSFMAQVTLSPGTNTIRAQAYNTTDRPGPTSDAIIVDYQVDADKVSAQEKQLEKQVVAQDQQIVVDGIDTILPLESTTNPQQPPSVQTAFTFRTFSQGQEFRWQLAVGNGIAPYDVAVAWGDGQSSASTIAAPSSFWIHHTYAKAGNYAIQVRTKDAGQHITDMQLAAFILDKDGRLPSAAGTTNNAQHNKAIAFAWIPYTIVGLMVLSFWLGERKVLESIRTRKAAKKRKPKPRR